MDVNEQLPRGTNRSSWTTTEEDDYSSLYSLEIWEEPGTCICSAKFRMLESSFEMAEEWTFAAKNAEVELAPTAAAFMSEAEEMVGEALQLGRESVEAVECFIQQILYGHSMEPRLPIFAEICPDDPEADDLQHNSTPLDSIPF